MGEICFEMTGPDGFSIQITDDQTFNCMVIENPGLEIPVPSIPSINPDTITEDFPTGSILVSNSNKVAAISQPLTIECNSGAAFPVLNGHVMQRRALASLWASLNPVMLAGELGIEVDTKQMKIGDGVTAWNSLAYSFDPIGTALGVIASHLSQPDPHTQYAHKATVAETFAPLFSPVFTGVPTAPTAPNGTQTAQLATTQFVSGAISAIPAANITAGTFSGAYVFANPVRLTVGPTNAPVVIRSAAYSDSIRPGDVLKYERGPGYGNNVVLVRDGINSFEFNPDNAFYYTTFNRVTLTTLFLSNVVAQLDGYVGIDGVTTGWHLTQYTGIYMCIGAGDYQGWGFSSTNTKRRLSGSKSTFVVNTDPVYRGQCQHYAQDATGTRNTFREWSDGSRGYTGFTLHATSPIDAEMNSSEMVFFTNGSGQLLIKFKDASGIVRTGIVSLT